MQIIWVHFQTFDYSDKNALGELNVKLWILPGTYGTSKLAPMLMLEKVIEVDSHSLFMSDGSQKNITWDSSYSWLRSIQLTLQPVLRNEADPIYHCLFPWFTVFIWRNIPARSQSLEMEVVEIRCLCWHVELLQLSIPYTFSKASNDYPAWCFPGTAETLRCTCCQGYLQNLLYPLSPKPSMPYADFLLCVRSISLEF